MQDAKKSIYYPDLYASYSEFKVIKKEGSKLWNEKPRLHICNVKENTVLESLQAHVDLYNIGLGASKNISIKWIYDIQKVKSIFNDSYQYSPRIETETEHIDFLQANGKIPIKIPEFYFNCCAEEYNLNIDNYKEMFESKKIFKPSLNLSITYDDIQNNKFEKLFDIFVYTFETKVTFKFTAKSNG